MITFIVIATAMGLAVAALLAVPLLSPRPVAPRSPWTALAVLVVLLGGAGALYATFSNWRWSGAEAEAAAASPQTMVATLARRLASHPDDLNGWLLLGRSYSVLEETPLAVHAYERANALAKGQNADALLGLAEALVSQDASQLTGRAGDLVEQALRLAPQSPKALFYGAAAAIQRKQLPLARQRFVALLAANPPDNVRPIVEQQINAIDQALGAAAPDAAPTGAAAPALRLPGSRRGLKLLSSLRLRLRSPARRMRPCLYSCEIRARQDPRWPSNAFRRISRRRWSSPRQTPCSRGTACRSGRMSRSWHGCPVRVARWRAPATRLVQLPTTSPRPALSAFSSIG